MLGSDDLKARSVVSLKDLGDGAVPSLRIAPFASRNSALTVGIRGIVPWAPLEKGDAAEADLAQLAANPLIKGIRRIIQFEADPEFRRGQACFVLFGLGEFHGPEIGEVGDGFRGAIGVGQGIERGFKAPLRSLILTAGSGAFLVRE